MNKILVFVSMCLLVACDGGTAKSKYGGIPVSNDVQLGHLLIRDGISYDQYTDKPATGKRTRLRYLNDKEIEAREIFKDGRLNGRYVEIDKESLFEMMRFWHYKDGVLHGRADGFRISGNILVHKGYYNNGRLDGIYEEFHVNGQLKRKINYKMGKKDGLHESWEKDGNKIESAEYKDDVFISGRYREFDVDSMSHEAEWTEGELIVTFLPHIPFDGRTGANDRAFKN